MHMTPSKNKFAIRVPTLTPSKNTLLNVTKDKIILQQINLK